jgi:GDP-L-fucose synthase
MQILVTGGSGMVGQYLHHLSNEYENIKFTFINSTDCDLTNSITVNDFFDNSKTKFDAIIHLAALVGGLFKNIDSPITMLNDNLKINTNILEACHKHNIRYGIFCLSSCIFPANPSKFPMTENMIDESKPHDSNQGYALAKRIMMTQCKLYNTLYNYNYVCLAPVNLYGKYDNFNLNNSHVIPSLIHRMFLYNKDDNTNNYLKIYGSGKALRQFLYAGDFARIILMILFDVINGNYNEPIINITNDDEFTIKHIVIKISEIFNIPSNNIRFDTLYSDGIIKKTISNNKFNTLYPSFNFSPFNEKLLDTIQWVQNNFNDIRK